MKNKKVTCPCCKSTIVIIDRYEQGEHLNENLEEPCNLCKHNGKDDDEYPCRFCSRIN